jgi:tripartite-type tricarboxylate transporter receptor subunit TctC
MNMRIALGLLVAALMGSGAALAQGWPDKPVTLVVPYPAGGSSDMVARAIAPRLTEILRQPIVVENRAGASGTIGALHVRRASADGHTLLVTALGPLVIAPHLLKNMPYDALKDFDLISVAVQAPNVLVVPAASPFRTVKDVIAFQQGKPGKLTFASAGNGSSDHITAALFWQQSGTTGMHIPYKGAAPAIQDLLGGQVDAAFQNINAVIQHIRAGKLRALAITGHKRSAVLPEVPTLKESGVDNVDAYSWQAVVAPKNLPADVRKKIHAAVVAAVNDRQIRAQFIALGFEVVGNTPAEFGTFMLSEHGRYKKIIEAGRITAD